MGFYVNPPADAFKAILRSKTYIDKSGLIAYTNQVLETSKMLTCFSRPRRFGKSFAAKMLTAYYSKGADSRELFENLEIAGMKDAQFEENLNKHDVLFLISHLLFRWQIQSMIPSVICSQTLFMN